MDTIIVACDTPDRRLLHQLAGLLHSYCTPAVTDSEEIQIAEHADLLLCRAENNCQIDGAGSVLILGEHCPAHPLLSVRGCRRVIFPAQNTACAALAASLGIAGLDCGLSLRDTLTLSSRTDSRAVVSLQRPIENLSGRRVEPCELPLCAPRDISPHALLCCAGVCILTGVLEDREPSSEGFSPPAGSPALLPSRGIGHSR